MSLVSQLWFPFLCSVVVLWKLKFVLNAKSTSVGLDTIFLKEIELLRGMCCFILKLDQTFSRGDIFQIFLLFRHFFSGLIAR